MFEVGIISYEIYLKTSTWLTVAVPLFHCIMHDKFTMPPFTLTNQCFAALIKHPVCFCQPTTYLGLSQGSILSQQLFHIYLHLSIHRTINALPLQNILYMHIFTQFRQWCIVLLVYVHHGVLIQLNETFPIYWLISLPNHGIACSVSHWYATCTDMSH